MYDAHELTELRSRTGLTQVQFAEAVGVDVSSLRRWEQGRRSLPRAVETIYILLEHSEDVRELIHQFGSAA